MMRFLSSATFLELIVAVGRGRRGTEDEFCTTSTYSTEPLSVAIKSGMGNRKKKKIEEVNLSFSIVGDLWIDPFLIKDGR